MTHISILFRELVRPAPSVEDIGHSRFDLHFRRPGFVQRTRRLQLGLAAMCGCLAMAGVASAATTDHAAAAEPTALATEAQTENTAITDLAVAEPSRGTPASALVPVSPQYQPQKADTEAEINTSDRSVQTSSAQSGTTAPAQDSEEQPATDVPRPAAVRPVTRSPLTTALVKARGRVTRTAVHRMLARAAATSRRASPKRYRVSILQYQFRSAISRSPMNESRNVRPDISKTRVKL